MLKEDTTNIKVLIKGHLKEGGDLMTTHHDELIEAIQRKMSELGMNATQLALKIGFSKSKVSEILNRKRPLSKRMAKALYRIGVSSEVLFKALIDVE